MVPEVLAEITRHPPVLIGGCAFAALSAGVIALSLVGETFFAPRLLALVCLVLPFLVAGAYGVLRGDDSSIRRFVTEGITNYFRVLLPALVVGFAIGAVVLLVLVPLALVVGAAVSEVAALAVLVTVGGLLSLYDTAACFEGLGVFAALRRSVSLIRAHPGVIVVFLFSMLAFLVATGFVLLVAWTAMLYERLEPLASMTPDQIAVFGREQFVTMLGTDGIALTSLCVGLFVLAAFVVVTTFKARVFSAVAETTPIVSQGEYDDKGRWYKY